ncbi:MAG: nucleoside hydrolase [Clostridiales bacterium]|jgi:hypothetical protein|nr:nucleoside hydrolase [Clostridiales bacterium]
MDRLRKNRIIIDTDLGCDCDDAGAVALANVLHNAGEGTVLAFLHSLAEKETAACVDLINRYYGNSFPIGVADNNNDDVRRYIRRGVYAMGRGCAVQLQDAAALLNELLGGEADGGVTLVAIGQQNNYARFLKDYPANIKKINKLVVMGGFFEQDEQYYLHGGNHRMEEFNIATDIASAKVVAEAGIPIVYSDFNLGKNILTGDVFTQKYIASPMAELYRIKGFINRSSWDLIATLYAFREESEIFSLSEPGTVHIDDGGRTTFEAGNGPHRLLKLNIADDDAARILTQIIDGGTGKIERKEYEKIVSDRIGNLSY